MRLFEAVLDMFEAPQQRGRTLDGRASPFAAQIEDTSLLARRDAGPLLSGMRAVPTLLLCGRERRLEPAGAS